MVKHRFTKLCYAATALMLALAPATAMAKPAHGIAMYGDPALPPDFVSLPYANPDAPKGGRITIAEPGGFDSLNPFILKGRAPTGIANLTVETLMGRSIDEPFTLYGLLAESVETDSARTYVEFTLREGARFSDGAPVTVEDVLWSFETLGTMVGSRYATAWAKVAKAGSTGPRSVRFDFNVADRELPLLMGLRPILQKAQFATRDFAVSSLDPLIGSGPYVIDKVEPGRFITYRRNPDWWGKDLPFNRGLHNFDQIRYDYFTDATVIFEAFKAGEVSTYRETNPVKWQEQYGFPGVTSGEVLKTEIPHKRPSGIDGFVFNMRKPVFADWRVREALTLAFNFELINQTLTGGAQPRIQSYFSNSELGMTLGTPATGAELALLEPFAKDLLPGVIDGTILPVSDGSVANRKNLRAASKLLAEAGFTDNSGQLIDPQGAPFAFEILLENGSDEKIGIASIYVEALKRLGIDARIVTVDSAQMKQRTDNYDFDMTHYIRTFSLSPGNEQTFYWGAKGINEPGSRNLMGMDVPAAEAMIATMVGARDRAEFATATRALDRILTAGRYVIPFWYADVSRIAHARQLKYPEKLPSYGDWPGFQPDVWWYQAD